MTDQEYFEMLKKKFEGHKIEDVVCSALVETVNITTNLEIQIKKLWAAVMFLFLLLVILAISGCAKPEVNKCTYICPGNNPPVGCYCLEDEINKEASGFHP